MESELSGYEWTPLGLARQRILATGPARDVERRAIAVGYEPLPALLRHMELYYSDRNIRLDVDSVLECAAPHHRGALESYASLRKRAPGFRPNDVRANNHNRINPAALSKLVPGSVRGDARMVACGRCGNEFSAGRSDARFCSAKCRQKASRMVR